MLELVRIEEAELYKTAPYYSHTFTLTFTDEKLPFQLWPLLEKELINYNGHLNHLQFNCQFIQLNNKNYINLFVNLKRRNNSFTYEEVDDFLEDLNFNFRNYYDSLLENISL